MVRRYPIQFVYKTEVPKGTYNGKVLSQMPLMQMLDILRESGVKFSFKAAAIKGEKEQIVIE